MPTKLVVKYGIDPDFARSTSMILIEDLEQNVGPTEGRVACVGAPNSAADVCVDMLFAWTGVCSIDGYNVFSATSHRYNVDNPDISISDSPEIVTYDYSGTTGVNREGVSGQYIGFRSVSAYKTSSYIHFWYPGGNFCRLGDRFDANLLTANGARLLSFIQLYSGAGRLCVTKANPASTAREFASLSNWDFFAYHGVFNG